MLLCGLRICLFKIPISPPPVNRTVVLCTAGHNDNKRCLIPHRRPCELYLVLSHLSHTSRRSSCKKALSSDVDECLRQIDVESLPPLMSFDMIQTEMATCTIRHLRAFPLRLCSYLMSQLVDHMVSAVMDTSKLPDLLQLALYACVVTSEKLPSAIDRLHAPCAPSQPPRLYAQDERHGRCNTHMHDRAPATQNPCRMLQCAFRAGDEDGRARPAHLDPPTPSPVQQVGGELVHGS